MSEKLLPVGEYIQEFNTLTGQSLPCCSIVKSCGLYKHVAKHHPDQVKNIQFIPQIISSPDYKQYHYVASVYSISNGKLQSRIRSGRLKKFV